MRPLLIAVVFASLTEACVLIEGDRILGEHLAAAHSGFANIQSAVDLGPAPLAATRRTFRPAELERIAKEQGIQLDTPATRETCFERATLRLQADQLKDTLSAVLQASKRTAEIEILDYTRTPLPVGQLEFRLDGLASTGLWRGRLLYGDNRSVPLTVRVRVTDSQSGRAIAIAAPPPTEEILRGEPVRVEVTSGAVFLAFDAAAEGSGHVGEAILVRNPANGQRLRVVVEGKGKAGIRK